MSGPPSSPAAGTPTAWSMPPDAVYDSATNTTITLPKPDHNDIQAIIRDPNDPTNLLIRGAADKIAAHKLAEEKKYAPGTRNNPIVITAGEFHSSKTPDRLKFIPKDSIIKIFSIEEPRIEDEDLTFYDHESELWVKDPENAMPLPIPGEEGYVGLQTDTINKDDMEVDDGSNANLPAALTFSAETYARQPYLKIYGPEDEAVIPEGYDVTGFGIYFDPLPASWMPTNMVQEFEGKRL